MRLYQGEFNRETVYSEDPLKTALHWESLGAKRLHIVDLDGSAAGEPVHIKIVNELIRNLRIPIQVGGGIRSLGSMQLLLGLGVDRVIFGTAAIEDRELIKRAVLEKQSAVVVGIDARKGMVATNAWTRQTSVKVINLVEQMSEIGVERVIYTDIEKDGTLLGPNLEGLEEIINAVKIKIIASGGISSHEHLRRLAGLKVEGAIIGKALYTGDINLKDALKITGKQG